MANAIAYVEEVTTRGARRRVRAAARVLLRRPGRFLRGDRQVPGGPARLRQHHDASASAPRSPSRCGCASTARPRRPRSPRPQPLRSTSSAPRCRRSPRCWAAPSPAHERHGRGVRDPLRGGDEDRAAHPADHRRGDAACARSSIRSAAPISWRALTTASSAGLRGAGRGRAPWAAPSRLIEEGWFQQRIADFAYDYGPAQGERREAGDRRQQVRRAGRAVRRRDPSVRPDDGRAPDRAAGAGAARARPGQGRRAARSSRRRRRRRAREHPSGHDRPGRGRRHHGRHRGAPEGSCGERIARGRSSDAAPLSRLRAFGRGADGLRADRGDHRPHGRRTGPRHAQLRDAARGRRLGARRRERVLRRAGDACTSPTARSPPTSATT